MVFHSPMQRLVLVSVLAAALAACGGGGAFRARDYPTPETMMEASKREFRKGHFAVAKQGFQRVTFEVPTNDPLGGEARYYLGESDFATGDYESAARTFRRVADDYENHPLAADALLRAGDALAAVWTKSELDPTSGEEALAAYQELTTRFPNSRAAERVKLRMGDLSDKFAEKQFKAGVFYYRLKAYDSAIIYFRAVVADFGQSRWAPLSLVKLVESYQRINYREEVNETCAYLRQYHPGIPDLDELCVQAAPPAPPAS